MRKHILKWKPVRLLSVCGTEYIEEELPVVVANYYKGALLEEILKWPNKSQFHLKWR